MSDFFNFLFECILICKTGRLTVRVTRWWAGGDNAALPEPASSHAKCLNMRRVPRQLLPALLACGSKGWKDQIFHPFLHLGSMSRDQCCNRDIRKSVAAMPDHLCSFYLGTMKQYFGTTLSTC